VGGPRTVTAPSPACFIRRDYHPGNTLWIEDQLTAVVDWTYASLGPVGVALGHMRWNLVLDYGPDAAERFLHHHAELAGTALHQPYWDIRTTVDLIGDGDPQDPLPARDLNGLEAHVTRALRALA